MSNETGRRANVVTTRGRQPPTEMDAWLDERTPEVMAPEHREAVMLGLEQSRRGEVATDEEVAAAFASFRQ